MDLRDNVSNQSIHGLEAFSQMARSTNLFSFSIQNDSFTLSLEEPALQPLYNLSAILPTRASYVAILIYGFFPSILEQSCWSKNNSFLGTYCQLGVRGCWVGGHAKASRNDLRQHDRSAVMCVYSLLFMRLAWMVQPRNYLLLSCHASNETVQLYQFSRWAKSQGYLSEKKDKAASQ